MRMRTLLNNGVVTGLIAGLVAGLALVATPVVAVASPAAAVWVDYAAPVITSPASGATVTGTPTVTLTSDAPYVAILAYDGTFGAFGRLYQLVEVVDGDASWDWPTFGFSATTLAVFPCQSSDPATCSNGAFTEMPLTVDNDVSSFAAPTEPTFVNPDTDGPLRVEVTDSNPGGTMHITLGGGKVADVTGNGPIELTFPGTNYQVGSLRVLRCSGLNGDICAPASPSSAEVTVRRTLVVSAGRSASVFSPNADGAQDTLIGYAYLEDLPDLAATWTITDLAGTALMSPQPITIAPDNLGRSTFSVDPWSAALVLSTGGYLLRVDAEATDHGQSFTGFGTTAIEVDVTPSLVTSMTPEYPTFYPNHDTWDSQYRNQVAVTAPFDGPGSFGPIEVLNSSDLVVDTVVATRSGGVEHFSWDGLNSHQLAFPEGTYRFRSTLTDPAGNSSQFTGGDVVLSHDAYLARTWSKKLSAARTVVKDWSGRCGLLRKPGLKGGPGSIGYYADAKCKGRTAAAGVAAALHGVIVPDAARYGALSIKAYGGAVDRYNRAGLIAFGNDGQAIGSLTALSPSWGWHAGARHKAGTMVYSDRAVYWMVNCAYGQRYDLAKFSLDLNYIVWANPDLARPAPASAPAGEAGRPSAPDVRAPGRAVLL